MSAELQKDDSGAPVQTLPELFFDAVDKRGDAPFLFAKRDGVWQSLSWREAGQRVSALSRGLISAGLKKGDRVVLVSENRPEWFLTDLAIMRAGGITTPAYTTNTIKDHLHILTDSGAAMAVVSTDRLAQNLVPACREAGVARLVAMETPTGDMSGMTVSDWHVLSTTAVEDGKDGNDGKDGGGAGAAARELDADDTACIIYTSGTGGAPAGVALSHRNILANVRSAEHVVRGLDGFRDGEERFLSFLPLSHAYEHTAGQFVPVVIGARIYYAEGLDKLVANIAEVAPTIMTAVPRLYESIRGRILNQANQAGGLRRALLMRTLALGRRRYEAPQTMGPGARLMDRLMDRLVRRKVAARFGGRLKAFISGGAPLNYDVGLFFTALGLQVLQGYGQTEAAPVISVNLPERNKLRTVGPPLRGVELRIADDGEILVRGDLVMQGYWNRPERTAETVIDGWLHTGDIGTIDDDGHLVITDRKRDIIVNSGGDNISPQRVEGILCLEAEIHQAMVIGDRRPHLAALLVPDPDWLAGFMRQAGADAAAPDGLQDHEGLRKAMSDAVARANEKLSGIEKIRRFILRIEPFSVENEMLTPSMKIRRHIIRAQHGAELDALYDS